jgi:hypothetical protein
MKMILPSDLDLASAHPRYHERIQCLEPSPGKSAIIQQRGGGYSNAISCCKVKEKQAPESTLTNA